ncbi:unnamed protein product [Gongylonema pulchrum]|uniref:CUT domain-containing protein n=1 Tax=Gongylonema pulchrum TaxID=637853 RepID=A0A183EC05_9BILA|nr:unnamed protein product [Gongylonema pulchrum]
MDSATFIPHQPQPSANLLNQEEQQQQELDHRLANAETPPAVSNVELASSFIATMIGEQQSNSPTSEHPVYRPERRDYASVDSSEIRTAEDMEMNAGTSGDDMSFVDDEPTSTARLTATAAGKPRTTYSTKDTSDPLNAEIEDDIYIDTTELCKRIAWELKQHSIPQAIFAERILCR